MINFKTQNIIGAVLLISIYEYVFGEPLSPQEEMPDIERCNEELYELCDGTTTAAACKSTILLNKLYIHYIEENYSRGYIDYIQNSTSMDGVLYIETYCQLFSVYDDCIAQIKEHFNSQVALDENQREKSFGHAIKNMTFDELLRNNQEYAKGYFIHLEDNGKLKDGTLSAYSWCDMLECIKELNILCNGFKKPNECKTEIFNKKLYSSYEEESYSRRYFDHIGENVSLENMQSIDEFCKSFRSRSYEICTKYILRKFQVLLGYNDSYQIMESFNYAFRELTLYDFVLIEDYAEKYFKFINVSSLVEGNALDLNQWCLKNCYNGD